MEQLIKNFSEDRNDFNDKFHRFLGFTLRSIARSDFLGSMLCVMLRLYFIYIDE